VNITELKKASDRVNTARYGKWLYPHHINQNMGLLTREEEEYPIG
jgi:hypothetical protein